MSKLQVYMNSGEQVLSPLDMHREIRSGNLEQTSAGVAVQRLETNAKTAMDTGSVLDITTWIKQAASKYHISADIKDYVMVPVVTVPAELPNRNGVGFPLSTLLEFIPDQGMLSYKTWKGKPTHYEHRNKDITAAKGVIADTHLRRLEGYGNDRIWKLVKLLCFDRSKDEVLVRRILSKDPAERINTYSMGAYLTGCECSYCGAPVGYCGHVSKDPSQVTFYEKDGHVVHKIMSGVTGFETSAVESPAWMVAISDDLVASPYEHKLKYTG